MKGCIAVLFLLFSVPVWSETKADVPLHHLVLVSFTENSTPAQRQQVIDDSLGLLKDIPGVEKVAAGNKARDERPVHIKNYDVGIYVQLRSEQDLDAYSRHPNHVLLLKRNKPTIASIQVIDFFSESTNMDLANE